ncbi:helix-turn-helix domain-containing protein [Psychromicrobium xiongbiense]|uniref:helix-turn-helix domain-containing protein n=1 Tax=Psychromicrobium xiongbiense TaxID=3051184 RepID=UPI002556ACAB|nr:helix-turn-helix domain-containing protein [Psychromicrobium sp. YIM S02556]
MESQDVEQLVEDVAARLGRGLSLEDVDGVLLAYSSNQTHADRVRVNFLLSKRVPADVSRWQLAHGVAVAVRPVVVPANEALGMLGRICVPLMVRGYRVGYLWIQLEESGSEDVHREGMQSSATAILGQLPAVRDQLDLLAAVLLDSHTAESEHRRAREQQFLAACAGEPAAQAELAAWPAFQPPASGSSKAGSWQVVCAVEVGVAQTEDPVAAVLTHRSAALQSTVGVDAVVFTAGTPSHSVFLFRDSQARAAHAGVLVHYQLELGKRLGRPAGRVVLGLSEPVSRLSALPVAYHQAQVAAQAGAVDAGFGELVECRDAGIYQLFAGSGAPGRGPTGRGAPGRVGERAASRVPDRVESVYYRRVRDEDSGHDLLPMLEMLYDSDAAVQQVADALHVHRSTIYNRVARVRRIIGTDPLRGAARLELHAALKAERWSRRPRL